jgi:hypothetical protein
MTVTFQLYPDNILPQFHVILRAWHTVSSSWTTNPLSQICWPAIGVNQSMATQNVVQNAAPSGVLNNASDEPISLGQISVKVEINATFGPTN